MADPVSDLAGKCRERARMDLYMAVMVCTVCTVHKIVGKSDSEITGEGRGSRFVQLFTAERFV